jgi:hypothetical protein
MMLAIGHACRRCCDCHMIVQLQLQHAHPWGTLGLMVVRQHPTSTGCSMPWRSDGDAVCCMGDGCATNTSRHALFTL